MDIFVNTYRTGLNSIVRKSGFAKLFHLRSSKASEHRCGRGELGAEKTRDS